MQDAAACIGSEANNFPDCLRARAPFSHPKPCFFMQLGSVRQLSPPTSLEQGLHSVGLQSGTAHVVHIRRGTAYALFV